ncbi:MAG: hypothetical protein Q9168_002276 [Polycauliona sp. 1 TL-2023]
MAPQNDTPPTSTTNVILGVTLSFGIVALMLGLYFIYKAYMKLLDHQRTKEIAFAKESQTPTTAHAPTKGTQQQEERPHPGHKKIGIEKDYRNSNAKYPPKETRNNSRGRRFESQQPTDSFNGRRVNGIPPTSRPRRTYQEKQKRRTQSVGPPPFNGGMYQPARFQNHGQYPYQDRGPVKERNSNLFRNSYPTQLPGGGVPRGQTAFGE